MVEKVFWYQYRDVASPVLMSEVARKYQSMPIQERQAYLQAAAPGHFGLYGGIEPNEYRKPSFFTFRYYPVPYPPPHSVYLPAVLKNYAGD